MENRERERAVWNPLVLAILSVPFTFLVPGILYGINYRKLGEPERAKSAIGYVLVGWLGYVLGGLALVNNWEMRGFLWMINLGVGVVFYQTQKDLFERHRNDGGREGSMMIPLLLALGWHLVTLVGGVWVRSVLG